VVIDKVFFVRYIDDEFVILAAINGSVRSIISFSSIAEVLRPTISWSNLDHSQWHTASVARSILAASGAMAFAFNAAGVKLGWPWLFVRARVYRRPIGEVQRLVFLDQVTVCAEGDRHQAQVEHQLRRPHASTLRHFRI
jgi:hypothetical protein